MQTQNTIPKRRGRPPLVRRGRPRKPKHVYEPIWTPAPKPIIQVSPEDSLTVVGKIKAMMTKQITTYSFVGGEQVRQLIEQGRTFWPLWPTQYGVTKTEDVYNMIKSCGESIPADIAFVSLIVSDNGGYGTRGLTAQQHKDFGTLIEGSFNTLDKVNSWLSILENNETETVTLPYNTTYFVMSAGDLFSEAYFRYLQFTENQPATSTPRFF